MSSSHDYLKTLMQVTVNLSPELSKYYLFKMVAKAATGKEENALAKGMKGSKILRCSFCKLPFEEEVQMRLEPRQKLTNKMKKLLHHHGNKGKPLGKFQQKIVSEFLQARNKMVIRCCYCKMVTKIDGQPYKDRQEQKEMLKLAQKSPDPPPVPLTKQQKKKEKQKKKKKIKKRLAALITGETTFLTDMKKKNVRFPAQKSEDESGHEASPEEKSESRIPPVKNIEKPSKQTSRAASQLDQKSIQTRDVPGENREKHALLSKPSTSSPASEVAPEATSSSQSSVIRQPKSSIIQKDMLSTTGAISKPLPSSAALSIKGPSKLSVQSKPQRSSTATSLRQTINSNLLNKSSNPISKKNKKEKFKQKTQTLANILKQEKKQKQEKKEASLLDFLSSVS